MINTATSTPTACACTSPRPVPPTVRRSCCATGSPSAGTRGATSCRRSATPGYHVLAPDQRGYGTTDRPPAVDEYTQLHLVGDIVGVLDAFGIDTAVVVGHDWGGPVAWHCALLRPDRFAGRRRAQRPLRRRRAGADAAHPAHRGDARRARRLVPLHPLLPGAGRRRARARRRSPAHARRRSCTGSRATCPATSTGSSTRRPTCFADVVHDLPGPLPWLSEADLDVFVESFAHHGTFPVASTGTATSTATRSCSARSRASASSSRRCSSAPSTTRSSVRPRRRCWRPAPCTEPARPDLGRRVGPLDPAGATGRGQRGVAGVPALVAGSGRPSRLTASAVDAIGRPTSPASATACSTSSTLVGECSGS